MATIVNARDVLLQAAGTRLLTVTQPSNMPVDFANVNGGTKPANNADVTVTAVNGGITVTGGGITLSSGGVIKGGQSAYDTGTGFTLGWNAGLGTYTFSIGNSAADKLTWNGSTLGIVGQITGGTIKIGSGHTPAGKALEINSVGSMFVDNMLGGILSGDNTYFTSIAPVQGTTWGTVEGVVGVTASANTNGAAHALRGTNAHTGAAGLVGGQNGYDFYADGSGTNYGPFTGTHDALVPRGGPPLVPGDLVVDVLCVARKNVSNTLFEVAPSGVANQPAVVGVVANQPAPLDDSPPAALMDGFDEQLDTSGRAAGIPDRVVRRPRASQGYAALQQAYQRIAINALGEGQINVCGQGGDIAAGDLLVASDRTGKGMRQADNVVRSHTVARAREAVSFNGAGQVKTVACIYLCG